METMEKYNITHITTGNRRGMMNRYNALLDKVINVLYWENKGDLYMKQYMGLYDTNNNHNREKIRIKVKKPIWPPMGKYNHPL